MVHEGLLRIGGKDAGQLRFVDRRAGPEFEQPVGPLLEILGGTRVPPMPEVVPEKVDSAWWRAHEDRLVWNARTRRFALRPVGAGS